MNYLKRNLWQSKALNEKIVQSKVVIGGMGGLGWFVGSQLVGLGVRNIAVFDYDGIEETNLNRLWGVNQDDIGKHKVDVFGELCHGIYPDLNIKKYPYSIPCLKFEKELSESSVVFGCYDQSEPRLATQVLSAMYNKVYIDMGTCVSDCDESFAGHGQAFLYPGFGACLLCAGLKLNSPGYLRDENGLVMPSTGIINSIVASTGISLWLESLVGKVQGNIVRFNWNPMGMETQIIEQKADCPICGDNITTTLLDFDYAKS